MIFEQPKVDNFCDISPIVCSTLSPSPFIACPKIRREKEGLSHELSIFSCPNIITHYLEIFKSFHWTL